MRWRRRRDVDAWVDAVARDRRPPRFGASDDDARAMLTAASLRAGRPGADAPRPEFVETLERALQARVRQDDGAAAAETRITPHPPLRGADAPRPEFVETLERALQARVRQDDGAAAATPRITRRRLLSGAAAAAAAAAVGAGVDRVVDRHGENSTSRARELVPDAGSWIDVAAVDDVPVGRPLRFSAGATEGFVVNHGDRVSAVSAMCTHMPCTLVFNSGAQRLDCPCHSAWFGLDGTPLGGSQYYPASLPPLPTLRSRVVDGRVQVFTA